MGAVSLVSTAVRTPILLAVTAPFIVALGLILVVAISPRSMVELERAAACELLACALALELGIGRCERRWIPHVVAALQELRRSGELVAAHADPWLPRPRPRGREVRSVSDSVSAAYAVAGWWDPQAPRLALIVALADEWAALTARDGPQLTHAAALAALRTLSGTRLDPAAVQAAAAIVSRERRISSHDAIQPRLHRCRRPDPAVVLRSMLIASRMGMPYSRCSPAPHAPAGHVAIGPGVQPRNTRSR